MTLVSVGELRDETLDSGDLSKQQCRFWLVTSLGETLLESARDDLGQVVASKLGQLLGQTVSLVTLDVQSRRRRGRKVYIMVPG